MMKSLLLVLLVCCCVKLSQQAGFSADVYRGNLCINGSVAPENMMEIFTTDPLPFLDIDMECQTAGCKGLYSCRASVRTIVACLNDVQLIILESYSNDFALVLMGSDYYYQTMCGAQINAIFGAESAAFVVGTDSIKARSQGYVYFALTNYTTRCATFSCENKSLIELKDVIN